MADDETIEEEIEVGKSSGKGLAIIIGIVALLLGAGGGVAGALLLKGNEPPPAAALPEAEVTAQAEVTSREATEVIGLGSFTVNLRDSAGGRLLQMDVSVEGEPVVAELVEDREAQVRDAILMLASDYTYIELEGMDGKLRLRDEIHRRVNSVVDPERITRVYFTSFVVQ